MSEDESLYEALDRAITARMRLLCEQALRSVCTELLQERGCYEGECGTDATGE